MSQETAFVPQLTGDGSFTFYSDAFGEAFHSQFGAFQEAELKYVEPTLLRLKAQQPRLRLLDVCYGLGYNSAAALACIWGVNPSCRVEIIGLELDPVVPLAAIAHHLLDKWSTNIVRILAQLATAHHVDTDLLTATLLIGDARETIQTVYERNFLADAIFLDPFSPPHCPQLWSVEFLAEVARCLNVDGRLATYSCAAAIRSALLGAGLKIGSTFPVGRKSPGTVAAWREPLPLLSAEEQARLQTRAAIPYRDPHLCDSPAVILQRRQHEQQHSSLLPSSQWKRDL